MIKTKQRTDLGQLIVFSIVLFFMSCDGNLDGENIAAYTINYRNGFIENALLGSIYDFLVRLMHIEICNYRCLQIAILIVTVIYMALTMYLIYTFISIIDEKYKKYGYMVAVVIVMIMSTNFGIHKNFGSIDLYLTIILECMLLPVIKKKNSWIVYPLLLIAELFYSGFVFVYFPIFVAIKLWYSLRDDNKGELKQLKYIVVFALGIYGVIKVFTFIHPIHVGSNVLDIQEAIMNSAEQADRLFSVGEITPDCYGGIVFGAELWQTKKHILEMIVALVLFSPLILIIRKVYKAVEKQSDINNFKMFYLLGLIAVPWGFLHSLTGRMFFVVMIYALLLIMVFLSDKSDMVVQAATKELSFFEKEKIVGIILLVYLVMMFPLWGSSINWMTGHVADALNRIIFHIW